MMLAFHASVTTHLFYVTAVFNIYIHRLFIQMSVNVLKYDNDISLLAAF